MTHTQRNDPSKKKECRNKDECIICTGSDPGACRVTGVSHKINCSGPTSELAEDQVKCKYERAVRNTSALWKHYICLSVGLL